MGKLYTVPGIFMIAACLGATTNEVRDLRVQPESFEGVTPINPENWVTSADYPEGIVRRTEMGVVGIYITINNQGRIENCTVSQSSGYQSLDNVPCIILIRRARFIINQDSDVDKYRGQMTFEFKF